MALDKSSIKRPVLRKEAVPVPDLGGEVIVRALTLSERFTLFAGIEGDGRYLQMARLLSLAVVDAKGEPLLTQDEWDIFGAEHFAAMSGLFDVAKRLSGLDAEAVAKN